MLGQKADTTGFLRVALLHIMRNRIFSRFNIALLFCNACLLFGIVYLWYPHVRDVRGEGEVLTVQEERLEISDQSGMNEPLDIEIQFSGNTNIQSTTTQEVAPTKNVGLTSAVNLSVPFTSQAPEGNWDQPWQDACEEAAILMLDAYYKKYNVSPLFSKDELLKMVDWQTERGLGYSIQMSDIKKTISWYMGDSFKFSILNNPTVEDIKQSLVAGHPVLVVAYGKALNNPHFSGEGPEYHALIIRGYTDEEFVTNDPGTKFGEGFKYSYENLMESIHDWNGGDVENGSSVVLRVDSLQ
jgi:hypothetical protein